MRILCRVPAGQPIPIQYQNASVRRGRHKMVSSRDRLVVVDDDGNYSYPDASKFSNEPAEGPAVITATEENDDGSRSVTANRPLSEDELRAYWGLSRDDWHLTKLVTNTWATNWQTKANWTRDDANVRAGLVWKSLLDRLRAESPEREAADGGTEGLFLLAMFDVHLGMLAWAEETGYENYDVEIAADLFRRAAHNLLLRAEHEGVEQIVIPIGNDFFHVDSTVNKVQATTRGTPQDVDGRWQRAFLLGVELWKEVIDEAAEIAPTYVIVQPGNHDKERAWMLGQVLEAWYAKHDGVDFDTRPQDRRYLHYGGNLLGFHHGDRMKPDKLYRMMSQEAESWSETTHREWLLGHLHHERYEKVDEHGMYIRVIPSITPPDAWHSEEAWIGSTRQAKGIVYRVEGGVTAEYSYLI